MLLPLTVVLVVARVSGWIANRVGQPAVVGEMAAGVLLGPIVMDAAMPVVHAALFSPTSLSGLSALSTQWRDNVRFESRELLPLAARLLDDDALRRLQEGMNARHRGPDRPSPPASVAVAVAVAVAGAEALWQQSLPGEV